MMVIFLSNVCHAKIRQISKESSFTPFEFLYQEYDYNSFIIYKVLENQKHSYITFLKDMDDNCYLVKQDKSVSVKSHLLPALEMLASYMCSHLGISAHSVEILPIGMSFPGKDIIDIPATIHTVVPGIIIKQVKNAKYHMLSINQGGNPQKAAQGLTRPVIRCMSLNADLPPIVALDTFIANRDRGRKNLLYDKKYDKFYAIDMAVIYDVKQNDYFIPELACKNVEVMMRNKVRFTRGEWQAIKSYYETLLRLLDNFPPEKTYFLFYQFIEQSGVFEKYKNHTESMNQIKLDNYLKIYKSMIEKAYSNNEKLVDLLAQLLQKSPYK
jgi:hypothetical protein